MVLDWYSIPQKHVDFINVSSIQSNGMPSFTLNVLEWQIRVGYLRQPFQWRKKTVRSLKYNNKISKNICTNQLFRRLWWAPAAADPGWGRSTGTWRRRTADRARARTCWYASCPWTKPRCCSSTSWEKDRREDELIINNQVHPPHTCSLQCCDRLWGAEGGWARSGRSSHTHSPRSTPAVLHTRLGLCSKCCASC